MSNHIEHIIKKVQTKLSTLRKFRRHISEITALRIYKSLIMCHMDYGDFVIDSGLKKNVDKLDKLQTKTIKCIEYQLDPDKHKDLETLYNKYKLEPLKVRRNRNLVKLMYAESKISANMEVALPKMALRSASSVKLIHRFTKLTKIQQSSYYRGLQLWDKLPPDIQKIESKIEFKSKIKSFKF